MKDCNAEFDQKFVILTMSYNNSHQRCKEWTDGLRITEKDSASVWIWLCLFIFLTGNPVKSQVQNQSCLRVAAGRNMMPPWNWVVNPVFIAMLSGAFHCCKHLAFPESGYSQSRAECVWVRTQILPSGSVVPSNRKKLWGRPLEKVGDQAKNTRSSLSNTSIPKVVTGRRRRTHFNIFLPLLIRRSLTIFNPAFTAFLSFSWDSWKAELFIIKTLIW